MSIAADNVHASVIKERGYRVQGYCTLASLWLLLLGKKQSLMSILLHVQVAGCNKLKFHVRSCALCRSL